MSSQANDNDDAGDEEDGWEADEARDSAEVQEAQLAQHGVVRVEGGVGLVRARAYPDQGFTSEWDEYRSQMMTSTLYDIVESSGSSSAAV